ncbi:AAA family ATPase [Candidatus Micrarchaeota archaeon]|nr:AAA family ATPase [Candidatus Micrarchaeota archaeon]
MRIKKIFLENLRSYVSQEVVFPEGVVLLEGDIGSGKSTLLYAVEFALFGLGDLNSAFLLRNSANEGRVRLDFSINGVDCVVERTLERKKKGIQQGNGYLEINGSRTEYSPAELKGAVLKLLEFNEPSSRSQSVIYRYAVFTPQEEMKKILEEKTSDRLDTLRKAFGIEDYERARENALLVSKSLKSDMDFLKGRLDSMPVVKQSIDSKTVELNRVSSDLASAEVVFREKSVLLEKISLEWESLLAVKQDFEKLSSELPLIEKRRLDLVNRSSSLDKDCSRLEEDKQRIEKLLPLEVVLPDKQALTKQLAGVEAIQRDLTSKIGAVQSKKKDFSSLKDKGVCPTCLQSFSDSFEDKIVHLTAEEGKLVAELSVFQKNALVLRNEMDSLLKLESEHKLRQELLFRISSIERELALKQAELKVLLKEIPLLESELVVKKNKLSDLAQVGLKASLTQDSLKRAQEEVNKALSLKSGLYSSKSALTAQLSELNNQLIGLENDSRKLVLISEKKKWVEEFFVPSMELIESHVMQSISSDFNELFQKWFSLLVDSGEIAVSSDYSFEPVISVSGYEQSFQSLSGGEKSALALAYRLALNSVVRRVSASMKDNLLILDEPTDGFSKEQLHKMRSVFNALDCDQVLIVSHERELEAFADHVIRVEKRGGISSISLS